MPDCETCACGHVMDEHEAGGLGPSECTLCECVQFEPTDFEDADA
jgi:hypothetical protein